MYLKRLEIHGFKSFAKKTVLEFEPGIISIVGPNGSGKSNIADSLRWVFGEQSLKLLRSKKSEDIIFAGSDTRARLGGTEVSVYFDNSDHKIPIDYEDVVITHRFYRDGNAEYLINNNQVRLLDIQDLLAKSGFGNTSYHVIGQGMIDQLILGGPVAVKELLEEAAGVKPYYLKRERAIRRLEHTEANLEQAKALISEIEPRLRSLRRQTKKLEQRASLEQELRDAQILHYGQILRRLERELQEVNGKSEIFDKQIQALNHESKALSAEIEVQERQIEEGGSDYKKLKADLEKLHAQKLEWQEELARIRGQLKVQGLPANPHEAPFGWQKIKAKFQAAYQRLLGLFRNFSEAEARQVQALFSEVAQMFAELNPESKEKSVLAELAAEEERLNQSLEKLLSEIKTLEADLENYAKAEEETKQQLFVKERLLRNKQETLVRTSEQKNFLSVESAKLMTRKEAYEQEAAVELDVGFREKIERSNGTAVPAGLPEKITKLKGQLAMVGGVDELVQQEYKETEERYQYLTSQCHDLEKGMADLKTVIKELDEVIKKEFHGAFTRISEKFAEYFRILFNGGRANMTIMREAIQQEVQGEKSEEEEPASSQDLRHSGRTEIVGIEIKATPPGKKLAGISALSGGERALTSIALLSAILATYPSPFVVLDEVDAALDEANSIRFGKILGTLAHKTQFITITHNRETMRQSHTLYGVTMGDDGVSKILSLKLEQATVYSSKN